MGRYVGRRLGSAASLMFLLAALAAPRMAMAHVAGEGTARATYDFNADWRLNVGDAPGAEAADFDHAKWKPVTLPRAWNEDDAFREDIRGLRTGVAWYRKRFTLPPEHAGRKVYLEFQGFRHAAEVYVNGQHVALHENGVMGCGVDVTKHVKPGPAQNVVAVRVDSDWSYREKATKTPYQWSDRNFYANYGGINKPVFLHVADPLHQTLPLFSNLGTTGVYVYANQFDIPGRAATITAEAQVKNEHDAPRTFTYAVTVTDPADGREVARFAASEPVTVAAGATATVKAIKRIKGLDFWSWGYGRLYDVTTTLAVDGKPIDAVRTRTGFRKTEFGNGLVKLNDRVIHLKGYAQRTSNEWPALGINIPAWVSDFSNGLMVQSNANLVRWMHVTPSKQDVESCDRLGLMQAVPAGDSEKDPGAGRRWEMRVEVMRDAIIHNRNNPSVLMWEGGNAAIADERMAEMIKVRDQFDPHGGRAMGSRNMLGSKVAEWGGDMLYVNKSKTKPLWATEYSRDEGLRKYWDELSPPYHKDGDGPPHKNEPATAYNRNQDSHAIEDVRRWFDYYEHRPGTGERVNAGAVNIIFSDTNTHHRGAENYRRSGEVDAMRLPKDGYHAHRVMWDGWVDVERPHAHIIGHWNYKAGTAKNVHVVSGAQRVELLLNGDRVGSAERSSQFLFTFTNVAWKPGTLEAVGYDASGKQVCSDVRKTAGDPVAIKLTPRTGPAGLRADGADVALVDVEVVDADGNRCPTALNPITFALSGPAEWRGGIAQAPDNGILATTLPVECGVNRVSIRSTTNAGKIELKATGDGLQAAAVTLESKGFGDAAKLTRWHGDAELKPNLSRGPTPPSMPLPLTRKPLKPARIL